MAEYIFRCDMSKQYDRHKKEIDGAIGRVLKSGVYILGNEVKLFERDFAAYAGRRHGIGVASGTDALIIALKAAGIRKGDRVITTTYAPTPVATAIVLAGGIPVFADIEENTCLIDPEAVRRKAKETLARFVIPVHIFGYMCDMDIMRDISRRYKLKIIEDCAQAHGSVFKGRRAGSFGAISCFSFYPTKNLGGYGDGGMALTDDASMAEDMRLRRNYGKRSNPFDSDIVGYNSRLDDMQAAILRIKLAHLDVMNESRARLAGLYRKGLKSPPMAFFEEHGSSVSNNHIMAVMCTERRDGLIKFLEKNGIQTNVYYPRPLHRMKAFNRYIGRSDRFPVSELVSKKALALPLYPELKEETVMLVIDRIRKFYS